MTEQELLEEIVQGMSELKAEIRIFGTKLEGVYIQLKDHEDRLRVIEKCSVEAIATQIESLEKRLRVVESTQNTNKGRDGNLNSVFMFILQVITIAVAAYAALKG